MTNNKIPDKRNQYLDTLKGFTIFLVVLGHSLQYCSKFSKDWVFLDEPLFKIIYSFHMPLFMVISGYLFFYSYKKHSTKKIIRQKFSKLIIPILLWNSAFLFLISCIYIMIGKFQFDVLSFISSYFIELWFLWAVFWCSIAILLIEKAFGGNILIYIVGGVFLSFLPNENNIQLYTFMYPYYVAGFLWNKYNLQLQVEKLLNGKKLVLLLFCLLILYGILLEFYDRSHYIYFSGTNILQSDSTSFYISIEHIRINLFRYTIGFIGLLLIMLFFKFIFEYYKSLSIGNILQVLGTQTLGIYITNRYCNFIFSYIPGKDSLGYIFVITLSIVETFLLYKFCLATNINIVLKKILWGL